MGARSFKNEGFDSCQCDVLSYAEGTVFKTSGTQIEDQARGMIMHYLVSVHKVGWLSQIVR
jgi:hypothetical protein